MSTPHSSDEPLLTPNVNSVADSKELRQLGTAEVDCPTVTLLSQFREDDVEVRDERIENGGEICPVQEVGDAAEQVPQQIAGSWDGRNMEHDRVINKERVPGVVKEFQFCA